MKKRAKEERSEEKKSREEKAKGEKRPRSRCLTSAKETIHPSSASASERVASVWV